tara:strand:+ start:240 stop:2135 length:1896 start_codon:yes stop_codon:yes gene_type:complete
MDTYWVEVTPEELADEHPSHANFKQLIIESNAGPRRRYLPVLKMSLSKRADIADETFAFGVGNDFFAAMRQLKVNLRKNAGLYSLKSAVAMKFVLGDPMTAAVFSTKETSKSSLNNSVSAAQLADIIEIHSLDSSALEIHLSQVQSPSFQEYSTKPISNAARVWEFQALKACATISEVYKSIPGASILTLVLEQELSSAKWIPKQGHDFENPKRAFGLPSQEFQHSQTTNQGTFPLTLKETFACICMLDSTYNMDPEALSNVFAMSTLNSIFVAASLLSDPLESCGAQVRRVIGNIGRSGISLLIPPQEPRHAKRADQDWKVINHAEFDGSSLDCFANTSIHLSFTDWEMALRAAKEPRNIIDRPIKLLETLVSVHDGSKWVADLDIIQGIQHIERGFGTWKNGCIAPYRKSNDQRQACEKRPPTTYSEALSDGPYSKAISIDNWDELFDPPLSKVIVVRAHRNWLARIALATTCYKLGYRTIVATEEPCWACLSQLLQDPPTEPLFTELHHLHGLDNRAISPDFSDRSTCSDMQLSGSDYDAGSVVSKDEGQFNNPPIVNDYEPLEIHDSAPPLDNPRVDQQAVRNPVDEREDGYKRWAFGRKTSEPGSDIDYHMEPNHKTADAKIAIIC